MSKITPQAAQRCTKKTLQEQLADLRAALDPEQKAKILGAMIAQRNDQKREVH